MNLKSLFIYKVFVSLLLLQLVLPDSTINAQNNPDTVFRIQIKENFDYPLSTVRVKQEYGLQTRVREFYFDGYYYYTIYYLNDLYKALEAYSYVVDNYGINDARIIKYVNGKRVYFPTDQRKYEQWYNNYKSGIVKTKPPEEKPKPDKEVPQTIEEEQKHVKEIPPQEKEVIEYKKEDTVFTDTSVGTDAETKKEKVETLPVKKKIRSSRRKDIKYIPVNRRIQTWLVKHIDKVQSSKIRNKLLQFTGIIFNNLFILAVIFLIVYFLLMSLIFSVSTMSIRFLKNRRKYKRKRLEEKYHNIIAEYLYKEKDANIVPAALFRQRSRFRKQIIIDVIVNLYVSLEGDVADKLRALYLNLRYNKVSLRKLKSSKWNIKAKGFRELANMDVEEAESKIRKYLNHRNDELRSEAHIAFVRLNKEEPFWFLNNLETYFTPWEMLNIHQVVKKYKIEVPQFMKWLNASNDTVIIFSLKMIIIFKQIDATPKLKPLLSHENELVREQAIKAVGELSQPDLADTLKLIYKSETETNKLSIIKALERIPNERQIDFLREILENEKTYTIRLEAARALYNIGPSGKLKLRLLKDANKPDLDQIYNHVTDVRI